MSPTICKKLCVTLPQFWQWNVEFLSVSDTSSRKKVGKIVLWDRYASKHIDSKQFFQAKQ